MAPAAHALAEPDVVAPSARRTLPRWTVLSLLAFTVILYGTNRLLAVPAGLKAMYFDGTDWKVESNAIAAVDRVPSTTVLKERVPDFEGRSFSVEWTGFITVPRSGTYTFRTVSDDGSWVYVHGKEVVANGGRHAATEARGAVALDAGSHSIFIRYFQDKGDCIFDLSWSRDGGAFEPVPAWTLLTEKVSYQRALAGRVTGIALMLVAIALYVAIAGVLLKLVVHASGRLVAFGRGGIDAPLRYVLLLSIALNVSGIWWAMPNTRGWAPDEVVPPDVVGAFQSWFSHGWNEKYPPFHYVVLSAADSPVLLLSSLGVVDVHATAAHALLMLIGRLVSVVFGAATIVVIYRCGLQLYGSKGAVFAALTTALTLPFAYYSKLSNLDVPYLFWFAVSLFAYIRILQRHDRRDYLLFTASAALAGCTKDQAWGLYFFTPLAILAARWRLWRQAGGSLVKVVFDGTTMSAIAVGLVVFLVADNVIFNFSGFAAHVKLLLGTPATVQEFPATVGGELQMAWRALQELRYMFGWPLAIIVVVALVRGVSGRTTTPSLRWLLVPALSYYVTFIGVILFFFDRYLLPIALILSLYAGFWLERFVAPGVRARRARMALVSAAFAYSAIYVVSVDYAMANDSRYAVSRWLQARARSDQVIGSFGPLEYALLADRFPWRSVGSVEDVAAIRPAFIVLNADQMPTLPPPVQTMHASLLDGRAGYRLALTVRSAALPLPGRHPDLDGPARHGPEFSDLSMINPTIEVFERLP
jgi:PA14 domain-containing protein/dolichyl-phosphate-mannose-protein mannosyltransferase